MLQSLNIKNFILIEKLELDFKEGFSVITGETGSGKSILLDAILFCFGEKVSRDVIRVGDDFTAVTISFSSNQFVENFLKNNDIESFEQEIIIKRTLNVGGKNKHLINDQLVSRKLVSELFNLLIEIHGQHSHTELLNPSLHLDILDEFAENTVILNDIKEKSVEIKNLQSQLDKINKHKNETEQEIEYLEYNCLELEKADIKINEAEELSDLKLKLQNRDKEIDLIQTIIADIESSHIEQIIAKAQKYISRSNNPADFEKAESHLEQAYDKIEEAKSEFEVLLKNFDEIPYSLSEVDDRLHLIKNLARKHSCLPGGLAEFLLKSQEKLKQLKSLVSSAEKIERQYAMARQEYLTIAKDLSGRRKIAINKLEEQTHLELSFLQMQKAKFLVEISSDEGSLQPTGIDQVRFTASTNPGTPRSPIDKIASGGELSRFMLAFRAALFGSKQAKAIIFDEIDVGISGGVAESIGIRLKSLSKESQLIVITHQPQVAGKANQHILVCKTQHDDRTEVTISEIFGEDKSREIARMIAGREITAASIKAANELIS